MLDDHIEGSEKLKAQLRQHAELTGMTGGMHAVSVTHQESCRIRESGDPEDCDCTPEIGSVEVDELKVETLIGLRELFTHILDELNDRMFDATRGPIMSRRALWAGIEEGLDVFGFFPPEGD